MTPKQRIPNHVKAAIEETTPLVMDARSALKRLRSLVFENKIAEALLLIGDIKDKLDSVAAVQTALMDGAYDRAQALVDEIVRERTKKE